MFLAAVSASKLTSLSPCLNGRCRTLNKKKRGRRRRRRRRRCAWLNNRGWCEMWLLWLPIGLPPRGVQGPLCKSAAHPRASCSTLDSSSTGRPLSLDSNASNASSSPVWHAEPDTDTTTTRPFARPKDRATNRDLFFHNLAQTHNIAYVDRVFDNVRQKLGRPEDDILDQIDTNQAIWGIYMITCTWAAAHFEKDYEEYLRVVRNTDFSKLWRSPWMKGTMVHEHVVRLLTAKRCMSFRVLCCALAADVQITSNVYNRGKTQIGWFVDSEFSGLLTLLDIVSWTVLTESLSCSSGRILQGTQHWNCSAKSKS